MTSNLAGTVGVGRLPAHFFYSALYVRVDQVYPPDAACSGERETDGGAKNRAVSPLPKSYRRPPNRNDGAARLIFALAGHRAMRPCAGNDDRGMSRARKGGARPHEEEREPAYFGLS